MVKKEFDKFGVYYYNELNNSHREDGPAIEYIDGYKAWYINDKRHRIDGPAIEHADGRKFYYLMHKKYSYEDWLVTKDFPLLW